MLEVRSTELNVRIVDEEECAESIVKSRQRADDVLMCTVLCISCWVGDDRYMRFVRELLY